jgi:hypothetical protein
MVQAGSTYDYDDSAEEEARRPDLRALTTTGDDEMADDGLRAAMRSLVESVNATYNQFAEAAENFAREAMRVMEDYASRAAHSAGESREMADVAGKAAEEARGISETLDAAIAAAREQFRSDIETILSEMRPQIDDAVRTANEALATARQAADEARQRSDEAYERIEISVNASREAASAAEAAAEAAHRSVESIEQAAAEASAGLRDEASHVDAEAASRIEQSLAASQEAASAAERAAEDARAAALEAMSHAAEARRPAEEAGGGAATQALLDRLEADYQLITELIQGLQARLAGLDRAPAAESLASNAEVQAEPWQDSFEIAVPVESAAPSDAVASWPSQSAETAPSYEAPPSYETAESEWAPASAEETPSWPEPLTPSAHVSEAEAAGTHDDWSATTAGPVAEEAAGDRAGSDAPGVAWDEDREPDSAPSSWPGPRLLWSAPDDLAPAETARSEWTEHTWPAEEVVGPQDAAPRTDAPDWEAPASPWQPVSASEASDPETAESAAEPVTAWTDSWQAEPAGSEPAAATTSWEASSSVYEAEEGPSGAAEAEPAWDAPVAAPATVEDEVATEEPGADATSWEASVAYASAAEHEDATVEDQRHASEAPLAPWSHPEYRPVLNAFAEDEGPAATHGQPPAAAAIEGRIVLNVTPVPDFDRLLSLDAALGRVSSVSNVTLADYAKEEVTFRVELAAPVDVEDFAAELSRTFGQPVGVAFAVAGEVRLEIVAPGQ